MTTSMDPSSPGILSSAAHEPAPMMGKPWRVLIVTAAYPTAGSHMGAFLEREVEGIRQLGVAVTVRHLHGRGKYARGLIATALPSVAAHFDIVHGHYSFCGAVALAQLALPKVITFWGTDVLRDPVQPDTRQNRMSRTLSPWLARHADACIVPFQKMADELHSPNVEVIPQGIDFEFFHIIPQEDARRAIGLDPDPAHRYILFCADPAWPRKGFDILAGAVKLMRSYNPNIEIVVANGMPHERVVLYMNACDVLAVPSSLESGPYVVKEAMAVNLPVVATDVGDVQQIIARTAGCAIAERTSDDFATKIWQSLERKQRTTGRQDIAHLSRDRLAQRIVAVYGRVLRQRERR